MLNATYARAVDLFGNAEELLARLALDRVVGGRQRQLGRLDGRQVLEVELGMPALDLVGAHVLEAD